MVTRRNSTVRAAHEADVDDVISLFDLLDAQGALDQVLFVAANLDLLPKYGLEEINITAVVERQIRTDSAIENISTTVQKLMVNQTAGTPSTDARDIQLSIQSVVMDMQPKFESFTANINNRIDYLNKVCVNFADSSQNKDSSVLDKAVPQFDRKNNVVVFGVKEDRDATVWRSNVDNILQFIIDRSVDVVDMFRLGKFTNSVKARPTLIKLGVTWDRRLLLNKSSKLKGYTQRGIFIAPDEPDDVRRKQTFERLKYRAERAGKCVEVSNNVLSIII